MSSRERLERVNQLIRERGLRWEAGQTPLSGLSLAKSGKLGLAFKKPGLIDKHLRLFAAEERLTKPSYPSQFDWRSVNGGTCVGPIRDQRECGSCVAFACVGVIECQACFEGRTFQAWRDLSEAFLFFCGGGDCALGWEVDDALDFAETTGITDESCFPYPNPATQQPCSRRCDDWHGRVHRISGSVVLRGPEFVKNWVSSRGPVIGGMDVYDDFADYVGGVYSPLRLGDSGGHAVGVVGYNDPQKYWICRNSWGSGWGERGYFRIEYGVCGMGGKYPMWGVRSTVPP